MHKLRDDFFICLMRLRHVNSIIEQVTSGENVLGDKRFHERVSELCLLYIVLGDCGNVDLR